jgi:hypothetical protein
MDILDLFMREDLDHAHSSGLIGEESSSSKGNSMPPEDLLQYLKEVRKHLLARDFLPPVSDLESEKPRIARHIAIGMKVKKVHEVDNFARYVNRLTAEISASGRREITHLVDFGSGQNYLGRALAAPPYSKHIIAVESKQHNIEGAKNMDVLAKLVAKPLVMRNKKEYRAGLKKGKKGPKPAVNGDNLPYTPESLVKPIVPSMESGIGSQNETICDECHPTPVPETTIPDGSDKDVNHAVAANGQDSRINKTTTTTLQIYNEGHGSVQYVEHIIKDGDLFPVVSQILDSSQIQEQNVTAKTKQVEEPTDLASVPKSTQPNLMVMSLHSCGNLVHHGLRSLLLNPAVSAVAMVGCCYNLVTERLGPPTYKLPTLRASHPRLEQTSNAFDPHGFPMSERLANYTLPHTPADTTGTDEHIIDPGEESLRGIRLNITARMMAVQAPYNWGREDSELFFTRHFYRALLQRIFMDRGVVSAPTSDDSIVGGSANGHSSKVNWTPPNGRGPGLSSDGTSTPLTIGTLRRFAYNDFRTYVRAAISKLTTPNTFCEVDPEFIRSKMDGLTDEDIWRYEEQYAEKKKELSVMWSLMAYSAGVVESLMVVDRWLWLKEQDGIDKAWVEPVFEYKFSPRNLVVVGIKR